MAKLPDISTDWIDGYAEPVACGYDALVETFNLHWPDALEDRLDEKKLEAQQLDTQGGGKVTLMFGGVEMQMSAFGAKGGVSWWLSCPEFHIMIRRGGKNWNVTVKYQAVALWCDGLDETRAAVRDALLQEMTPNCPQEAAQDELNWCTVSRADFAFDLHSAAFSAEMVPDILNCILCNSKIKKHAVVDVWERGGKLETITIGKVNSLQIQIYDKGREIREASGKEWMLELWKKNGFKPEDEEKITDVWRVEIRFGKSWLKNRRIPDGSRNLKTFEDLDSALPELLCEALYSRRLVSKPRKIGGDTNKARWDVHPLFSECLIQSGDVGRTLPLGRIASGSRDEAAERLTRQIAGTVRTLAVIKDGKCDDLEAMNLMVNDCYDTMRLDPDRQRKEQKSQERYKHMGRAV